MWWDNLSQLRPTFGYHPNDSKTYLVVKQQHEATARQVFANCGVHITTQGKRHLGASNSSRIFTEEYVSRKVQTRTQEIKQFANVAASQPHAAYAAFTHGLASRWSYIQRTIPDIEDLQQPLENAIHQRFIPALVGRPPTSKLWHF